MLFSISQGFSVPYQFLFREWIELPAVLRTEVTGWDMQWLFSASVTFYVLDYPYCGYWQIFILCNSWVIILLKIHKPAFLVIKHPCSIRVWVPVSVCLSFFLCLSLSLSYHWLWIGRFWSIKGPQHPGVGLLGHMVFLFLVFKRTSIPFSIAAILIYIPTNSTGGFPFLHVISSIYCS